MSLFASLATTPVVLALALLTGCTSIPLLEGHREEVCRIAVDARFAQPVFHPNPLSNAGGGLVGAGGGALAGLHGDLLAIFTVPIGAAIGASYGTACAAASLEHPTADADFERFLRQADSSVLKRALEEALNTPRPECGHVGPDNSASATPDAIIEIEKIEVGMGCLFGQLEYWVAVEWRMIKTKTSKVLAEATTRCEQTSFRSVDDWFANPDYANAEIKRVLVKTGQRMATELLVQSTYRCVLRSRESGEIEAR